MQGQDGEKVHQGLGAPTCLTVVAKEALRADTQVGPPAGLTPAAVLAGAAATGVQLWRTPRGWARARGGLGKGGEGSGKKGKETGRAGTGLAGNPQPPHTPWSVRGPSGTPARVQAAQARCWDWGSLPSSLPVSHWAPVKWSGHWQTKAPGRALHDPPFLHG